MFGIFPAAPDLGPDGRCSSPRLLREQFMKFAEALNGLGISCRQWEILKRNGGFNAQIRGKSWKIRD